MCVALDDIEVRFLRSKADHFPFARDDFVRMRAAKDMSQYVSTQARELKSELFGEFMSDLNKHIQQLVSSSNSNDVIGGIIAINELIEVDFRSHTIALARLAESLKVGLNSGDATVLSLAAQALGRLSRLPITLTSEICVGELKRALESLKEKQESRRQGAVLVLRAMASEAPTLFYGQMSTFVDVVWYAMRDSRQVVRMLAAETLGIALRLIGERDNAFQWNRYLYESTINGFRATSEPEVHGSLLALGELLTNARDFMSGRTNEVCNLLQRYALKEKDKSTIIKQTVISLLPKAAASNPDAFVASSLPTFTDYLLGIITSPSSSKSNTSSSSSSSSASGASTGAVGLMNNPFSAGLIPGVSPIATGLIPSVAFYGSSTSYLLSHYGYSASMPYTGSAGGASAFFSQPGLYDSHGTSFGNANMSGSSVPSSASSSQVGSTNSLPISATSVPIPFFYPSDSSDRSLALFAVGELALALGSRSDKFKKEDLDRVIKEIQETLTHHSPAVSVKQRTSAAQVNDALACLTMLAQAVGPAIHQGTGMRALLDQIFSVKLSPQLISALTALVNHIPSLVKDIQLRLVEKLSGVLRQKFTPNTKSSSSSSSSSSSTFGVPSSPSSPSLAVSSPISTASSSSGHSTLSSKDAKKASKTLTSTNSTKSLPGPLNSSAHLTRESSSIIGDGSASSDAAKDSPSSGASASANAATSASSTSKDSSANASVAISGALGSARDPSSAASVPSSGVGVGGVGGGAGSMNTGSSSSASGGTTVGGGAKDASSTGAGVGGSSGLSGSGLNSTATVSVLSSSVPLEEERTPELIALALNTLGSFNVIGYIQNIDEFLRDIAVNFLEEDNTTIRREAAVAVPQLLVRLCSNPKFMSGSTPISSFPLSEVIERLLLVGISDVDPAIRHTVLIHLEPTLDAFMAAPENLRCLFIALNDEVFAIRETAIAIIGRLSLRNPSDVMPSLRRTLIQLLTELEFGGDSRLKAESAQLLSVLIRNSRNLIEPYVKPILKALLPKLDPSQDPRVRQEILSAVGELAPAGQDMVASHMDTLIPLIISYLADQSAAGRRELALRVLAQLNRYTSHVVDPLTRWPDLLHLLLAIAKTEKSKFVRRQVLRVLGTLGALDPYMYKMTQPSQGANVMEADEDDEDKNYRQQLKQLVAARVAKPGNTTNAGANNANMNNQNARAMMVMDPSLHAANTTLLLGPSMSSRKAAFSDPNSDTYYPYVAIKALSNILWDPSLGAYHEKVVKSIVMITKECVAESKVQLFLTVIMPPFLHLLGGAEPAFSVLLLNQISLLVTIAKGTPSVREYLTHVFQMVSDLWHTDLLPAILQFIEEISSVMGDEFMVFLPFLIPKLLSVLDSDNVDSCMRILRTLEWVGPSLDDYLHLVAPAIVTMVSQSDSEIIRIAAMQTIGRLCRVLNFSEYASRIIQPMARLLQTQVLSNEFKNAILAALCHLVHQLGSDYAIFVPVMNRILSKRQITHATYEFLVSKVLKNQAILESELPPLGEIVIVSTQASTSSSTSTSSSSSSKSAKGKEKDKEKDKESKTSKRDSKNTTGGGAGGDDSKAKDGAAGGVNAAGVAGTLTSGAANTGVGGVVPMAAVGAAGGGGMGAVGGGVDGGVGGANPRASMMLPGASSSGVGPNGLVSGELKVNESNLRNTWAASSQSTRDDWDEWMRRFSVELVRESPQPALRYCLELAQEYFPLVKDVFTAAFVSCWDALSRQARSEFTDNLVTALKSPHMPREILQQWLNVAEFMEQARIDPIEISKELGRLAFKCHAYAKALHYKELEFSKQQTPEAVEALITINTQLQQPEAAEGMLRYSQERMNLDLRESWYEKLHRWEDALLVHQSKRPKSLVSSISSARAVSSPGGASGGGSSSGGVGGASANLPVPATASAVSWPQPTIPTHDHHRYHATHHHSPNGSSTTHSAAGGGSDSVSTLAPQSARSSTPTSSTGAPNPSSSSPAPSQTQHATGKSSSESAGGGGLTSRADSTLSSASSAANIASALQLQQKQQEVYNQSIVGEMRCLHSLGEWDRLLELSIENWKPEHRNRTSIAPWAASAAWHLHDWSAMATFLEDLKETNVESLMMRTVLQLQKASSPAEFEHVRFLIDKTRDAVDVEMTPLLAESYQRAYDALINVQLLSEMEEVIDFKMYPERRSVIRRVWRERLDRCQRSVATWQRILAVRAIAEMEESTWLKFAMLCRKSGALRQSHKVLTILMGTDPAKQPMAPLPTHRPSVTYQYILQLWTAGAREIAYQHLLKFESYLEQHRPTPVEAELGTSLAALGLTGSWAGTSSSSLQTSGPAAAAAAANVVSVVSNATGQMMMGGALTGMMSTALGNKRRANRAAGGTGANAIASVVAGGGVSGYSNLILKTSNASPFALLSANKTVKAKASAAPGNTTTTTSASNSSSFSASANRMKKSLVGRNGLPDSSPSAVSGLGGTAPFADPRSAKMQARCALTLGLWQLDMHEHSLDSEKIDLIIRNLGKALVCDPTWHKAWHVWATTNFDMATIYEKRMARHAQRRKQAIPQPSVVAANAAAPTASTAALAAPAAATASQGTNATASTNTTTTASTNTTSNNGSHARQTSSPAVVSQTSSTSSSTQAANVSNANNTNTGTTTTTPGHTPGTTRKATGSNASASGSTLNPAAAGTASNNVAASTSTTSTAGPSQKDMVQQQQHNSMTLDKERLFRHVEAAVKGFFRSIALSHGAQTLQDTLRLLTMWFKYGGDRLIEPVLQEGFNSVPIDTWLPVIPQIIARMDSNNLNVRRMVLELLSRIGKEHPQALVYPLVLTAKSTNTTRQSMAHSMMNQMRQYDQLHFNYTDYGVAMGVRSMMMYASGAGGGGAAAAAGGSGGVNVGGANNTNGAMGVAGGVGQNGAAFGNASTNKTRRYFAHEDDDDDIGWAFSPNGGHDQILVGENEKNAARRNRPMYSTFAAGEEGMFTHHANMRLGSNYGGVGNTGGGGGAGDGSGAGGPNATVNASRGGVEGWFANDDGGANVYRGGSNGASGGQGGYGSSSNQANFLSLIDQALLISEELIRVAISDTEAWHECLEEASRAYFVEHNPAQMIAAVRPLHEALLQPANFATSSLNENGVVGGRLHTSMELSFRQSYSAPLNQAWGWCLKYLETGSTMCLNQAWDLYWYVYHAINKQQEKLTTLQLSAVSPRLLGLTQLSLAVPGTYQVGGTPVVTITGFHPVVSIIPSKQRPRKLRMTGSDGVHYSFLLKGHEDLRQDERVMQLFGLINNLLLANPQTANKHLRIQRFAVIPLSPNSGLIGWVPHCDTMNALIKEYRATVEPKIPVDSENQILEKQYPEYPQLMVIQKIEVFKLMTARFDGKDLANIMWLKSPSSEVWLDRRTNYIRSLAVMSMAGYILGLGDRHPSNIMIDRYSGHVVHIDFGDCFETAMLREKHPEKVPFRLTRMVINAMEVSGIEGTFRTTCNQVLEVLRENRDSLMAVLEAFVHDPLINWGLKNKVNNAKDSREAATTGAAQGHAQGANKDGTTNNATGANGEAGSPSGNNNNNNGGNANNGGNGNNTGGQGNINSGFSSASLHETISSSGAFSAASHRFRDYNFQDDEGADGYNFRHGGTSVISHPGATPSHAAAAADRQQHKTSEKELNERALAVISRVHNKLTGRDFGNQRNQGRAPLTVPEQVSKLILQATSTENLCQSFAGWCPWW